MEVTSQATQVQASAPSAMPMNAAQPSAYQSVTSQPSISPEFQAAPVAPQIPYQAPAQAQQVSTPQGNPWQEAFQALSASLNTSSPSQAQVPSSAYLTPTPQAHQQASWASQAQASVGAYGAADLQSPSFNPGLLNSPGANAGSGSKAPAQGQVSDAYLSQISDASLEVLEHFGAEAPVLLNQYACAVEDALIEQVQTVQSQSLMLSAAGEERAAMNLMLTDPDVLADYVNDFYGANGPYPTPTAEEAAYLQNEAARAQFEQEILAQERSIGVPQNFQRPEMAMPTPGRQVNAG